MSTPVPYELMTGFLQVCQLIQQGKVPTIACDIAGVSYSTFTKYCDQNPQLASLRDHAEDVLYDRMADALPRIFDDPEYGTLDPKRANVISGNIKWLLARRRQKYGDKVEHLHTISADRAVLDALHRARERHAGSIEPSKQDVVDLTLEDGVASVVSDAAKVAHRIMARPDYHPDYDPAELEKLK